jgi:hypothetical protein
MTGLRLTLNRHWFDQIVSGKKTVEYREIKPYWTARLEWGGRVRRFNRIEFRNGYHAGARTVTVECLGITKNLQSGFYEIRLGRIL